VPALQNDTLIALSSRQIGAMVWTNDADDFSLIRQQQLFRLRIIERRAERR
jgi:predicted nucleic acid-binding protein